MSRTFAYIPDGLRRKLTAAELKTHEYWGKDFLDGTNSVAVFQDAKGHKTAVWSYGDWKGYDVPQGGWVTFEHTQTNRHKDLQLVAILDRETALVDFGKMNQWTLK